MTDLLDDQMLVQLVRRIDPQSKLLRTWQLKGGISAQMTALEILRAEGLTQKLIVRRPGERMLKQNLHAAADEFKLLQILQATGLATQRAYYLDESGRIIPTPYLVIEYIEGNPDFAPSNLADYIHQLAAHLAKINGVDGSHLDLAFLPTQPTRFAATHGDRPAPGDIAFVERRIREILVSASDGPQLNKSVLLHGDFWPGNLLWKDNCLVAVIDWENAKLGDPLADIAISRLDILWAFGSDAMDAFTDEYQSMTSIDTTTLPYWDLCAALRAAPNLAEWASIYPLFGRNDIAEETVRARHNFFVSQALEKQSAD
jgi:aminoglycoside phosphotransferase (APT) family kinase protein